MITDFRNKIFNIKSYSDFLEITLEVFKYQYDNNAVYREFITGLGKDPSFVKSVSGIPFLPVEFFRNQKIITGEFSFETIFQSSGTTGVSPAMHFVKDIRLYEESFLKAFRLFYGNPEDYLILALLPSYIENERSSLVFMADSLIKRSRQTGSGFYKDNTDAVLKKIDLAKKADQQTLLIGVSFALLDLAEKKSSDLSRVIVMETGGMKGRRKELTRQELHKILKERFNVTSIHSEYGMTELMSQAYSKGEGIFFSPPWMKVMIRDPLDALTIYAEPGKTGGINIIDLANINSCSFIATGDLGRVQNDGGFEVLGRFDNSDIRGCNLLTE